MTIAAALTYYAREQAVSVADPTRIRYAIEALVGWWGDSPVSAITGATCRRYARERGVGAGTTRRELGCLSAALRHCKREGYLVWHPAVVPPPKPPPRERWLTRPEAARLLAAARRLGYRHLCRFILVSLYTGTRRDDVLALQWQPNTDGGHVDLEAGLLHRKSAFARRTKKRGSAVRIPRQLRGHLRRWARAGGQHVIEWRDKPVAAIRRAWRAAREDAGLDAEVTPHTLKHTAVT